MPKNSDTEDQAEEDAFAAALAAAAFADELDDLRFDEVAHRFEITLHARESPAALFGAEDVLKGRYARKSSAPRCEQIWAGPLARPEGGMVFAAFDAYGAPLLRRSFAFAGATR